MIPVIWLVDHPECWDQALLDATLSGKLWPTGYQFDHRIGFGDEKGAVVVIPGANQAHCADEINAQLSALDWAFVIVTSDEQRAFPLAALSHPNMALWLQYPRQDDQADDYLPVGWPPWYPTELLGCDDERKHVWAFSGQVNNRRRRQAVEALRPLRETGVLNETPGFTQGLGWSEYAQLMSSASVIPCPSGPHSVDTFRVWEALEAGAIPLADARLPSGRNDSWLWGLVLHEKPPFPMVTDWQQALDASFNLGDRARIAAWWQGWKRRLSERIGDTVHRLSGTEPETAPLTALIPTSPIASHPDEGIITETIASIRHWHPTAEIVIMCDGVRPEQERYRVRYEMYLERLTWLAARDGRILLVVHDEHLHQAEMTRRALDLVKTPQVLFVEHDTPLVTDEHIDWAALSDAVSSGEADVIRFHYETGVHPDHEYLMLDRTPKDLRGAPLLRTVQWSQRPHLALTAFYRRVLAEEFPAGYTGMIEDHMHGVVHNAWRSYGLAGWDRYRLWMYAPDGSIKRSYHLDARGTDPKWVDS